MQDLPYHFALGCKGTAQLRATSKGVSFIKRQQESPDYQMSAYS